jgi:metal-dependent amidase/aminoacylase/carboxypeptidase family protein
MAKNSIKSIWQGAKKKKRVTMLKHFLAMRATKRQKAAPELNIRPEVEQACDQLVNIRRELHKNAQVSFEETYAQQLILRHLNELGADNFESITSMGAAPDGFTGAVPAQYTRVPATGVVAVIKGGAGEGPCIALRADTDALPILEVSDKPYCSTNVGSMHACGHDGHVAMLLVATQLLLQKKGQLRGTIKLIFQPAEEFGFGAKYMVNDGCLKGVDFIYGIHLMNTLTTGTIGVKAGPLMAAPVGAPLPPPPPPSSTFRPPSHSVFFSSFCPCLSHSRPRARWSFACPPG